MIHTSVSNNSCDRSIRSCKHPPASVGGGGFSCKIRNLSGWNITTRWCKCWTSGGSHRKRHSMYQFSYFSIRSPARGGRACQKIFSKIIQQSSHLSDSSRLVCSAYLYLLVSKHTCISFELYDLQTLESVVSNKKTIEDDYKRPSLFWNLNTFNVWFQVL